MRKTLAWIGSGLLLTALLAQAGEDKAQTFRGEIADTQCALNVHSLTRSHTEMLKSKNMGGTRSHMRDLLRAIPGRRFCVVVEDRGLPSGQSGEECGSSQDRK